MADATSVTPPSPGLSATLLSNKFIPLVSEKCDVGFPKTICSCLAAVTKVMLTCH